MEGVAERRVDPVSHMRTAENSDGRRRAIHRVWAVWSMVGWCAVTMRSGPCEKVRFSPWWSPRARCVLLWSLRLAARSRRHPRAVALGKVVDDRCEVFLG